MSRVSGRNTAPEIVVRKLLHGMGFRFRLHDNRLPGNPDIVLPRHKKIVLVHGCFWHGHVNCNRSKQPTTNVEFWNGKITGNIKRDKAINEALTGLGWQVLTIWQCETKKQEKLIELLDNFLKKENEQ